MSKTQQLFFDNAITTLSGGISNVSTVMVVASAAAFPGSLTGGQQFYLTLDDGVNTEIVLVTAISGTSLTIVRGQQGTTAQTYAGGTSVQNRLTASDLSSFARLVDRMDTLSSINSLGPPSSMNSNSYIITGTFNTDGPAVIAISTGSYWSFPQFPLLIESGAVGSGATTTTIPVTGIGTSLTDSFTGAYMIQFVTGANIGVCRILNSIAPNSIGWATALPNSVLSTDTYEILRYVGSNIGTQLATHTNQIATLNTEVALLAPLASPNLTGVPTAPTAAPGTNTTQIATTAYVQSVTPVSSQVLSSTGAISFPIGGVLIKCGNIAVNPGSVGVSTPGDIPNSGYAMTITFNSPFSTSVLAMTFSFKDTLIASNKGPVICTISSYVTGVGGITGVNVFLLETNSVVQNLTLNYIAIGY